MKEGGSFENLIAAVLLLKMQKEQNNQHKMVWF